MSCAWCGGVGCGLCGVALADEPPSRGPVAELLRGRTAAETVPEMVHKAEIERSVRRALEGLKQELFAEFVANADRLALERAIVEAKAAKDGADRAMADTLGARQVSHRRFMRLIATHAVTGALVLLLVGTVAMLYAFATENRARVERLEMLYDHITHQ